MSVFKVVFTDGKLKCLNAGEFTSSGAETSNVTIEGSNVVLLGAIYGSPSPACTKAPPVFPAPCTSFAPAITFSAFPTFEGKKPVVEMSVQICIQNGIPSFQYTSTSSNVKVM